MGSVLCAGRVGYQLRSVARNLIWRRGSPRARMRSAYLADYCAPEAAVRRPLELRDTVLLVRADGPPECRDALALAVRVGLGRGVSAQGARGAGASSGRERTWKR